MITRTSTRIAVASQPAPALLASIPRLKLRHERLNGRAHKDLSIRLRTAYRASKREQMSDKDRKLRISALEAHIEAMCRELRLREIECPNVANTRRELERILE